MDCHRFLRQNGRALTRELHRAGAAVATLLTSALAVLGAQQATPAPKPLIPAAANSIAANPQPYIGHVVTVYAAVDRILSPTSFAVDQDPTRSSADQVVVIARVLTAVPVVNEYVTVIGEVVMADGGAAIKATTVLDARMVDLAKIPLPPLTAEEQAFDAVMKRVQPAFGALRTAVNESNGDAARAHAATLKQAFTDAEAFFKKRGKADAEKWSLEARTNAESLERVAAGNWDEARTALTRLQQSCSTCHAVYRERQDDGSYRIRADK